MNPGPRYLGIDHGAKRIGLAYGDELGVATPMPAIVGGEPAKRWERLAAVIKERKISEIVLGLPFNMDGTSGPKAREAEALALRLRAEFQIPVHLADERLSSYEAESTIPASKRRSVRSSGTTDSRAAAIILQDFFSAREIGREGTSP